MGSGSSEEKETKEIAEATNKEKSKITISELVIVDVNNIKITAKEYVEDSIWGDGISLQIENNMDRDVSISCEALIVNNYMITDLFSEEVTAGKKANEVMHLSSSELKAAGIDSVGQVEIYFRYMIHLHKSPSFVIIGRNPLPLGGGRRLVNLLIMESDTITFKTK